MIRVTTKKTFIFILITGFFLFALLGQSNRVEKNDLAIFFVLYGLLIMAISVMAFHIFRRFEKMAFDIANQPILEVREAVSGVTFASEARVSTKQPIVSKYGKVPCVYFHCIVEKYIRQGKNSFWKTIENITEYAPFACITDETGNLDIDLRSSDKDGSSKPQVHINTSNFAHSEIDCAPLIRFRDPSKEPFSGIEFPSGKIRVSEYVLFPDTPVFAYGYVVKDEKNNKLLLTENIDTPFILSRKTAREYLVDFEKGNSLYVFSPVFFLGGFYSIIFSLKFIGLVSSGALFILAYGAFCLMIISIFFLFYNKSVLLRNRAKNAFGNLEGELKRRSDIVPQLVSAVEGYVAHENNMFSLIASLRSGAHNGGVEEAKAFRHSLEAYPAFKSSDLFIDLSNELVDTEERIAYSRSFYNKTVERYNTNIAQFPYSFIAWFTHQKPLSFFYFGD